MRILVSEFVLIASTASLIIELVVFGLLSFGYYFKRNKKYRQHGIAMTIAVVLHLVTIFAWMAGSVPSYFGGGAPIDYSNPLILAMLLHLVMGAIAAASGVWLIGAWHLQTDIQRCFARKRIMLTTITLWSIAFALGVFLYVAVITS